MSQTAYIVIGAVAALILLILILRNRTGNDAARIADAPEEGDGVSDGFAAAVEDVVGDITGVEVNPDTPGDTDVRREPGSGSGGQASIAQGGAGDALTQIKGLGAKAEGKLNAIGVVRFEQIAGWTEDDLAMLERDLGIGERAQRDRWVEQAGLLARGETAAFEETFGRLG